MSIDIRVSGGPAMASALDAPTLTGPAVELLVNAGADRSQRIAQDRAPEKGGKLKGSITKQMSGSLLSRRGKLTNDVSNKGFRYGWALETSKRRVYRYRSSGPVGDSTRGWFSKTARLAADQIAADLARSDSDITRRWNAL